MFIPWSKVCFLWDWVWPSWSTYFNFSKREKANLCHDLWIRFSDRVSPLHGDGVAPHLHLPAHQAPPSLSGRLVVLVLQKAEAAVLLLIVRLVVQNHVLKTLCREKNTSDTNKPDWNGFQIKTTTGNRPVTLPKSSSMLSLVLFLGIDPTNSRLFATDIQTPKYLPGRISWLSH